jgi:hypothetical protein
MLELLGALYIANSGYYDNNNNKQHSSKKQHLSGTLLNCDNFHEVIHNTLEIEINLPLRLESLFIQLE